MPYSTKRQSGHRAEVLACQHLQEKGLLLLEKNFQCRFGEIDLIMQDGDHIVFVEVRSRSRTDYGQVSESINRHKQDKIIKTATYYLQQQQWLYTRHSRFDVVAIQASADTLTLDWFKNAFWAGQ